MPTKIECPHCGQHLEADESIEELAGQQIECPTCNTSFEIQSPPSSSRERRRPKGAALSAKQTDQGQTFPSRPSRVSKGVLVLMGTLAIFVLALGGTVLYLMTRGPQTQTQPATQTPKPSHEAAQGSSFTPKRDTPSPDQRVKATVKGGAWVTKKSGNSEVLRGLKIYFLRRDAKNEQLLAMQTARKIFWEASLVKAKEKMAFDREWAAKYPDNESMQADAKKSKAVADLIDIILKQTVEDVQRTSQSAATATVDFKSIYKEDAEDALRSVRTVFTSYSPYLSDFSPEIWGAFAAVQRINDTHASIDGTYELEITGEPGYLYSRYETDYSIIEWFLPIHAKKGDEIKLDLQNSNAEFIRNKSDN